MRKETDMINELKNLEDSYILTARTDDMTGELGLTFEDVPQFAELFSASEGRLLAHDLLEHVNGLKEIGTVADELQALGAVMYIRGEAFAISKQQRQSSEEIIASDLIEQFRYYRQDGMSMTTPDNEPDEWALGIMDEAEPVIKYEWDEEDRDAEFYEELNRFLESVPHFLQMGYDKAEALYPCQEEALMLFDNIGEALDPHCKPDYEGQQVEMTINKDNGNVYVDEYYGEWDEEE